jgi:hypothetical protein
MPQLICVMNTFVCYLKKLIGGNNVKKLKKWRGGIANPARGF